MELQFRKKPVSCLRGIKSQVLGQEQTVEVRLDDSLPPVGSILGAWGQFVLRGKEWRSGSLQVTGGVMARVLYLPENGGACACAEGWLPFSWKVDIPAAGQDGTLIASGLIRSMDARSLTAKKLMVRANVQMHIQALVPEQVQLFEAEAVPEDVQLLEKTCSLQIPMEAGEKPFVIDEILRLPGSCVAMEKLLYYRLQPEVAEKKVMADKVVFRGAGMLHMLYLGQDGRLHTWDFELPYAQYGELAGQFSESGEAEIRLAVTNLEVKENQDGSMLVSAGIVGQFLVYDTVCVALVVDAYSTKGGVTPQFEQVLLPQVRQRESKTLSCQQQLQAEAEQVVDGVFWPEQPSMVRTDEGVSLELAGQFQALYYGKDGSLQVGSCDWSRQEMVPVGEGCSLEAWAWVTGATQMSREGGMAAVRAELLLDTVSLWSEGLKTIGALERSEQEVESGDRPSLILRRAGKESLWDMAKAAGSTVEAIKTANSLTDDPPPERMLIVPVC